MSGCTGDDTILLVFSHWYSFQTEGSTQKYDGALLQVSDGGPWADIAPEGGYDGNLNTEDACHMDGKPGFEGDPASWETAAFDITLSAGMPSFRIRFWMGADGDTAEAGWYVDDVRIIVPDNPCGDAGVSDAGGGYDAGPADCISSGGRCQSWILPPWGCHSNEHQEDLPGCGGFMEFCCVPD